MNTTIIIITVDITPYDTSAWVCFVRHQCKYMLEYLLSVTKYCSSQFDFLNKISRTYVKKARLDHTDQRCYDLKLKYKAGTMFRPPVH